LRAAKLETMHSPKSEDEQQVLMGWLEKAVPERY
jgi:hypothetical protein